MKLNKDIDVSSVIVLECAEDSEGIEYPISYEVKLTFFGYEFTYIFNVDNLRTFYREGTLPNSYCSGCEYLFISAASFFECNEAYARKLVNMMKDAWNCWDYESKYDFLSDLRVTN